MTEVSCRLSINTLKHLRYEHSEFIMTHNYSRCHMWSITKIAVVKPIEYRTEFTLDTWPLVLPNRSQTLFYLHAFLFCYNPMVL